MVFALATTVCVVALFSSMDGSSFQELCAVYIHPFEEFICLVRSELEIGILKRAKSQERKPADLSFFSLSVRTQKSPTATSFIIIHPNL